MKTPPPLVMVGRALTRRCPNCGGGRLYQVWFRSVARCPTCGLRLERGEEGWIITDLESTNGVVVVASDGTETLLDRGASSPVTGRFILGKVAMSIVEEGASA